jgi:hydroxymethylpyrimidine pyrophosphatase-like HAD family hydrolase
MDSDLTPAQALRRFLADGQFATAGAVITDLDGTAVLEREGRIYLPPTVEGGLEHIRRLGRPVIANTLRFPLSVISVFGDEWHRSTGTDLPLVSMKGSQIGRVVRDEAGAMCFEEWHAETLTPTEIREVMVGVEGMVDDGVRDLLVFHYPRDWRQGELIWTPDADRVDAVAAKYRSATRVLSSDVRAFGDSLLAQEMCMIFLLIDLPEDRRMAYQHTQRASFFTRAGVNKRTGAEAMARHLGIDLAASIGAGDAPPDDFLAAVGFAIIVGDNGEVDYRGLSHTARVPDIASFGHLLAVTGESLE